jgi:hypothetical protein
LEVGLHVQSHYRWAEAVKIYQQITKGQETEDYPTVSGRFYGCHGLDHEPPPLGIIISNVFPSKSDNNQGMYLNVGFLSLFCNMVMGTLVKY